LRALSLPKAKRTHIPALSKNDLIVTLDKLSKLTIPKASKDAISAILRSAANPDHAKIDVVVKSVSPTRQKMISKTARQVRGITQGVTVRGKARLESMSDEEWQRLQDDKTD
jgi:hypothetical protein